MSVFEPLGKLYRNVIDELHVGARHIVGQVQVHLLNVREDCAAIVGFNEREVTLALQVDEAVERSADISVSWYINPPCNVFIVRYLPDNKVTLEVLMVDYVLSVADHMLDNSLTIQYALAQSKDAIMVYFLRCTLFPLSLFAYGFLLTVLFGKSRRNLRNSVVCYHLNFLFTDYLNFLNYNYISNLNIFKF